MSIQFQLNRLQTAISSAFTACDEKNATMPTQQIIENLSECIDSIPQGISPTGNIEITTNGEYDIANYELADVNVSNLTKYTSGNITISSDIAAAQTSYDTSKLKITVGFAPKIFIFRPGNYSLGRTLGKYSTSYHMITSSVNVYEGLIENAALESGMGTRFSSFITKLTASSSWGSTTVSISGAETSLSLSNTGFYLNPSNSNEVYWYITSAEYAIRAGTWFWEAYA